jgi:hypothetical protein
MKLREKLIFLIFQKRYSKNDFKCTHARTYTHAYIYYIYIYIYINYNYILYT